VETTHWADLAENFKIQDAACLMAGVPPVKELAAWSDKLPPEARYVFERLWKAYMQGAGVYRQPKLDSADFQKMLHGIGGNDFQAPTIAPARGLVRHQNMLIAPSAELMRKRLESVRVSRDELHRWVKATGIRSAYSFAPVVNAPGAELSTQPAPAQTAATPAPVVAVGASGGVVADKAGPMNRGWVMKKAALIKKHTDQWATIKGDFHSASENGLSKAAKAPGHGEWFEADALKWAEQRGKLKKKEEQGPATIETVWTGRKHALRG
jgi:hypothetical protein